MDKKFLRSVPDKPGIYQMYDGNNIVLYVGKAKSLKKRLSNYFNSVRDNKTAAFMQQVKNIEFIITENENAAFLLESNLIKSLKPKYNILFKDDKSFPYLLLSKHDFPRLSIYRGPVNKNMGKFFGPFPSATAVNLIFDLLQKIFKIRVCRDSFFRNRSRPCMLYQIKLCKAPCVNYINKDEYASEVKLIEQFLHNKNDQVVAEITKLMDVAAAKLNYEQAALYRDQISSIRKIQLQQVVSQAQGNIDIIALASNENNICIDLLIVRNGLVLGNKTYFPVRHKMQLADDQIVEIFIQQHYLTHCLNNYPDKILLNIKLPNKSEYSQLNIIDKVYGPLKSLVDMANTNAVNALKTRLVGSLKYIDCLLSFKEFFQLSNLPKRIECFDISHTMGESQVASCVVFDEYGPVKNAYRRYNIKTVAAGDDYEAMNIALMRRYEEFKDLPDVIIIDGGKGQLGVARQVLQQLNINNVFLLAVAKGPERKPGLEEVYISGKEDPIVLPQDSLMLYFIQRIRDEAHRFAVSSHRKKMRKTRKQSILENIDGVGAARRAILLKHFGGLAELKSAGIEDIAKIKGINYDLARRIYEYLHNE